MIRDLPFGLKHVVEAGHTLSRNEAGAALEWMLAPPATFAQEPDLSQSGEFHATVAALLTAMAVRGETADELAGFAEAMRAAATSLPLREDEKAQLVDTCGTGGDGLGTFNISTGAALVAAAAGAKVAKHGNRAVTSKCGSADVLEALGVPVGLGPDAAVACLRATGFMFLLATALHPSMRRVAPVRRSLGFRTIFNLAGPLTNPAGAQAQVMGVWAEAKIGVVAEAMQLLGVRHAFVVHGDSGGAQGLDELTVTGLSHVAEVRRGEAPQQADIRRFTLEPQQFGLAQAPLSALGGGGSAAESAEVLLSIFRGEERGPRRQIVMLNAAAALVAGGVAGEWREGLDRAGAAIDTGTVLKVLAGLRGFAG